MHAGLAARIFLAGKAEAELPPAHKLQVNFRQKLAIEQRAVFRAVGIVDAETAA